jgi:hypothetical protein
MATTCAVPSTYSDAGVVTGGGFGSQVQMISTRVGSGISLYLNFGICGGTIAEIPLPDLSGEPFGCEDAATIYAKQTADSIISEFAKRQIISIHPSSIEQFEGDILIRWHLADKTMMLVCPAEEGQQAILYREISASTNEGARTLLKKSATADDLAYGMSWMLSGFADF